MSKDLIERLRYVCGVGIEAADRIEQLERELAEARRPNFREIREMLRAMQAGELTVSRGVELLEIWHAGNYSDDMLPPVRQDLIEQDSMPVEIIDRLKAELAEANADAEKACDGEKSALTKLRIALKAQAQEPVAVVTEGLKYGGHSHRHEPTVRSIVPYKPIDTLPVGTKLYTTPQPSAQDAKDAARYRWLKKNCNSGLDVNDDKPQLIHLDVKFSSCNWEAELDAAIDAARGEG